ncbi:MAG: HAD-IC family P-type ATPase [Nanoarchaeota archaeon]
MGDAYYSLDSRKVVSSLGTNASKGLSNAIAGERLKDFGLNEIKSEGGVRAFTIFLRQFKSFIIYILIFALLFSIIVREYVDAWVIFAILMLNAFFGFVQEYRAEKSIESLRKLSSLKARVIRDFEMREIDSKFLVPGDIVVLEEGGKVPADGRVLESYSLSIFESSLTGESSPSSKNNNVLTRDLVINDQKNMVFSGTLVTKGRGIFVVTSTGMKTELGRIAHLLSSVEKETTVLQKKLDKFGKYVGYGVILISLIIFVIGAIREQLFSELLSGNYSEFLIQSRKWFLMAVALAVAAVPEGLPAVVTISLAIGVKRMLKKRSLIRRLPSVETLGETTVICCDKTGTLTKNEMTVRNLFVNDQDYSVSGEGYSTNGLISLYGKPFTEKDNLILKIGSLCNNSQIHVSLNDVSITGDPTEAALLVSASKAGLDYRKLRESFPKVNELTFDSERKMMSTVHRDGKSFILYNKGAPEKVLEKCSHILFRGRVVILKEDMWKKIIEQNKVYANQALRVLGFAYKKINNIKDATEKNLIFVGLQGMIDPPKEEISECVSKSHGAGIRVIMITGDNINTAVAVAREIGLTGESIEGAYFAQLGDIEKRNVIQNVNIFARVEPKHKLEIVRLLQESGAVVAMTGDGVNDAPALKQADIGIAMGVKGTDVSREASDMVLQDDNFATIVSAVEEGRGIYSNILSFVSYLISSNLAEVLIVIIAILFGLPLPITALMLLWINLVTDGLPALALSVDPYPKGLMDKHPRQKNEPLMTKARTFNIFYVSSLIAAGVLGLFVWGLRTYQNDIAHVQTIAFTSLVLFELVRAYFVRAESGVPLLSNVWLLGAVLVSFGLQLAVVYTPLQYLFGTVALSLSDWASIAIVTFMLFTFNIIGLAVQRRFGDK